MTVFKCTVESDSGKMTFTSTAAIANEKDDYPSGMGDAVGAAVLMGDECHAMQVLMEAANYMLVSGSVERNYCNEPFLDAALECLTRYEKARKKANAKAEKEMAEFNASMQHT